MIGWDSCIKNPRISQSPSSERALRLFLFRRKPDSSRNMSQLETAMGMTIAVFDKYAKTDGNRQTLSKAELKTLLEKELPNFLSVRKQCGIISV